MKVVVCVKHVPDGQGDRRIEEGRIVRGEDDTLNELDEYAIEAAVSLVEQFGGQTIAVTMGPDDADEAILRALQMGADSGIHVSDELLAGTDAPGTAAVLAAVVRRLEVDGPVDLIVTGMASLDGMTSMVPAALAADLAIPLLGLASSVEPIGDGPTALRVTRNADGWEDVLEAPLPLVMSVTDQINEPRYPSFKSLKAARAKPVEVVTLADLNPHAPENLPTHAVVIDARPLERAGTPQIIQDTGDGGLRLAEYLSQHTK